MGCTGSKPRFKGLRFNRRRRSVRPQYRIRNFKSSSSGISSKMGSNNSVSSDESDGVDEVSKLRGDVIKQIFDLDINKGTYKNDLSRFAGNIGIDIKNLDEKELKESVVNTLLDLNNDKPEGLRIQPPNTTSSCNNVEAAEDSALTERVINGILASNPNEIPEDHQSKLSELAETLGINTDNIDNSELKERLINGLLDFNKQQHGGRFSQPSATSSINAEADISALNARIKSLSDPDYKIHGAQASSSTTTNSDDEWWQNSKYFDRMVSEGDETKTKPEEKPKFGDCYIFNYQKFKDGLPTHPGSEKDVARLRHDFNALDFNVFSDFLDLTIQGTLDVLKQAAESDHTQSKCFVCCFLTYGENGSLLMNDGYLEVDRILERFSRSACKSLAGIPKIFIFQDCGKSSLGEEASDSGSHAKTPDYQDFLLLYSTYEDTILGDKEKAENNHGSFFINELGRTLEQFSVNSDLLQILTILNYRVANFALRHTKHEEMDKKKHIPGFTSKLTTVVKFGKEIPKFTEDTEFFDTRRMHFFSLGKKSTKRPLEDKKVYQIQSTKRIKFLLMLNTKDFTNRDIVCRLWSTVTEAGYRNAMLSKWSEEELEDFLQEVKARGLSNTDCLICFIICQAEGDNLRAFNGQTFPKKYIAEQFAGCRALRGKPKIFIFLIHSSTTETWRSCYFADITDSDEDSLIPAHSDLLDVTINIKDTKLLNDVMEGFCNIFGKASLDDFLTQLTRMNKELTKENELVPVSNEKLSPTPNKLPSNFRSNPKKPNNALDRILRFLSVSQNSSQKSSRNNICKESLNNEESKVPQSSPTFCVSSTLTETLILNNITHPNLTETKRTFHETI